MSLGTPKEPIGWIKSLFFFLVNMLNPAPWTGGFLELEGILPAQEATEHREINQKWRLSQTQII